MVNSTSTVINFRQKADKENNQILRSAPASISLKNLNCENRIYACSVKKLRKANIRRNRDLVKFIYSEKATKFCEVSTVDLTGST